MKRPCCCAFNINNTPLSFLHTQGSKQPLASMRQLLPCHFYKGAWSVIQIINLSQSLLSSFLLLSSQQSPKILHMQLVFYIVYRLLIALTVMQAITQRCTNYDIAVYRQVNKYPNKHNKQKVLNKRCYNMWLNSTISSYNLMSFSKFSLKTLSQTQLHLLIQRGFFNQSYA